MPKHYKIIHNNKTMCLLLHGLWQVFILKELIKKDKMPLLSLSHSPIAGRSGMFCHCFHHQSHRNSLDTVSSNGMEVVAMGRGTT